MNDTRVDGYRVLSSFASAMNGTKCPIECNVATAICLGAVSASESDACSCAAPSDDKLAAVTHKLAINTKPIITSMLETRHDAIPQLIYEQGGWGLAARTRAREQSRVSEQGNG